MLFSLILGLLIGAVTVIFALQNLATVSITFLAWQLEGSLCLILLLAVLAGVIICILLTIPEVIQNHINIRTLKNQKKQLEDENTHYKRIVDDMAKLNEVKARESQSTTLL